MLKIQLAFWGLAILLTAIFIMPVHADEYEEITKKIAELERDKNMSINATAPHEAEINRLEKEMNSIAARIAQIEKDAIKKEKDISVTEKKLEGSQGVFEQKVRDTYKKLGNDNMEWLNILLSPADENLIRLSMYHQAVINRDKREVVSYALSLKDLENQKKELEATKAWLAVKKLDLEKIAKPIKELVAGAKKYQQNLSQEIAGLTARQQQIIAERIGSLNLSRSANISMACADDRNIDPGFSPRFAFFTFGIPHRVGMNQFGAFGRANAGQGYQEILRAYYNGINFEKRSNINIRVQNYGSMSLEQYLLGIYEVPESWPMGALKAQAVAARSYALAYTNNGANEICTTQECQVYKGGNKGGNWEKAVKETEGEVLVSSGQVIKAWYSSTFGGYTLTSGEVWNTDKPWTKHSRDTSGEINNLTDLFSKSYDRDSPCFYNAQGWRKEYNKSAWLKPEEVADIVNVIMLSADNNAVDTWDVEKVKNELKNKGTQPFNRIDNISMSWDFGSGRTTSVTLSGDVGSKTIDGQTFKDYFNVRAPANIAIVGPLYNIEKK